MSVQIDAGAQGVSVYSHTLYILAALLAGGLACNLAIRPVPERWFTTTEAAHPQRTVGPAVVAHGTLNIALVVGWLAVGLPLAWGFYKTVVKASALFT
jgi:hypothetical protein